MLMTLIYTSNSIEKLEARNRSQRDSIDMLKSNLDAVMNMEIVQVYDNNKTGDWIRFYKIGRNKPIGYYYETNLKLDEEKRFILNEWIWQSDSAGIDLSFMLNTLFRETRIGTNINHRINNNGTLDGGWSGINSITAMIYGYRLRDMKYYNNEIKCFIRYCNDNLNNVPRRDWDKVYIGGLTNYNKEKE